MHGQHHKAWSSSSAERPLRLVCLLQHGYGHCSPCCRHEGRLPHYRSSLSIMDRGRPCCRHEGRLPHYSCAGEKQQPLEPDANAGNAEHRTCQGSACVCCAALRARACYICMLYAHIACCICTLYAHIACCICMLYAHACGAHGSRPKHRKRAHAHEKRTSSCAWHPRMRHACRTALATRHGHTSRRKLVQVDMVGTARGPRSPRIFRNETR